MRKFIFFLLLIPALASLGHDIYIYQQNPDKGFHFFAIGALWDKYHKESHDKWKSTVKEISNSAIDTISNVSDNNKKKITIYDETKPAFMEEFLQTDSKDRATQIKPLSNEKNIDKKTNSLIKFIGIILEQKAFFLFSAIAAIAFILNTILNLLFKSKEGVNKVKYAKKVHKKTLAVRARSLKCL